MKAKKFLTVLLLMLLFMVIAATLIACGDDEYTVTFDVAGGKETIESQTVKQGYKATKPEDPTREGYTFLGWYVQDEKWVFIEHSVTQDITLTAKWWHSSCSFTVKSETEECLKSAATCHSPAEYYYKCVWCDKHGQETYTVGDVISHSYTEKKIASTYLKSAATCMAAAEYYYKCAWCDLHGTDTYGNGETLPHKYTEKRETAMYLKTAATCQEKAVYYYKCSACDDCGTSTYTVDGKGSHRLNSNHICEICSGSYIYFGEYPQTVKAAAVSITTTTDSRGYYLGSDGSYYAKVTAIPYGSSYKFSTGDIIEQGKVYYFKVEPILWRILSRDNSTALILCDSIIANKPFDKSGEYSNNYANSDIRAWLNAEFYNTAFTVLQKELILITTVDNSATSTGIRDNPNACENTQDCIFLLSYADVNNAAYGFSTLSWEDDIARRMQTSDYSRATGADTNMLTNVINEEYGNGEWWLRSAYSFNTNCAQRVMEDGYIYNGNVNYICYGVVPALRIRL